MGARDEAAQFVDGGARLAFVKVHIGPEEAQEVAGVAAARSLQLEGAVIVGARFGVIAEEGMNMRALLHGRYHVSVGDIQSLALPVLRHRVIPNFYAESERITSDKLVERLLEAVPPPRSGM